MTSIDWKYVHANADYPNLRYVETTGKQVGVLTFLLNAGMHYEEAKQLRDLSTKARLVSEYLLEVDRRTSGMVPGGKTPPNQPGS